MLFPLRNCSEVEAIEHYRNKPLKAVPGKSDEEKEEVYRSWNNVWMLLESARHATALTS
jgi:hypothetical protein